MRLFEIILPGRYLSVVLLTLNRAFPSESSYNLQLKPIVKQQFLQNSIFKITNLLLLST